MSTIEERLDRLERELVTQRRAARRWRALALVGGLALLVGLPALSVAGGAKKALYLASADGRSEVDILPDHIEFRVDGEPRMRLEVGADWAAQSIYGPQGNVAWLAGQDANGASLKLFSGEGSLQVEVAGELLDSGSGLRLYDTQGNPRASLYSNKRGGESGMELSDPDRQPRVGVYAMPDGVSVIRASTSEADALVELSLQPRSDVMSRYTGGIPEAEEGEPFVPMLYLQDASGQRLLSPAIR